MYLVTYFVTNFVSFSVRKYSHFSSPYLVMYLVIYFVTFLVKSHVLLYWRSIIGATKYRTYLDCLPMQFYGDFKFNLALVVSSLIINISCPLLSFGAEGRSHKEKWTRGSRESQGRPVLFKVAITKGRRTTNCGDVKGRGRSSNTSASILSDQSTRIVRQPSKLLLCSWSTRKWLWLGL